VILLAAVLAAQALTLEKISEPGPAAPSWAWRDATHVTWVVSDGPGPEAPATLWQLDTATGKKTKLFEPMTVKDRDGKNGTLSPRGGKWSPLGDVLLVSFDRDLWLLAPGGAPLRLTNDPDDEESPAFAPDGTRVAYVKKSDLWAVERESGRETRLTSSTASSTGSTKRSWRAGTEAALSSGRRTLPQSPISAWTRIACPPFRSWTSRP